MLPACWKITCQNHLFDCLMNHYKNYKVVYLIGFLLPLYSLSLRIGIEISLYKVLPLIIILISFLYLRNIIFNPVITKYCMMLFVLFIVTTSIHYYIIYDDGFMQDSVWGGLTDVQAYMHMPIQLLTIILLVSNLFMLRNLIYNEISLNKFINGFVDGNIFSVVMGVLLSILYYIGINFEIYKIYLVGGVVRLAGLGGEPRHFSSLLVVSVMIRVLNNRTNLFIIKNQSLKSLILLAGLFISFSTSSWLGFLLMLLYFIISSNHKKIIPNIAIAAVLLLSINSVFSETIYDKLWGRISNGYSQFAYYAPKDALVIDLLKSNPINLFFGAGSGGADYYIMSTGVLANADEKIISTMIMQAALNNERQASLSASSFVIRYIGDFGIVGLFLLGMLIFRLGKMIKSTNARQFYVGTTYIMFLTGVVMSAISFYMFIILISAILGVYIKK